MKNSSTKTIQSEMSNTMDKAFDEMICEGLDLGDELIARVKGKKLSEFTKEEENTWIGISAEIHGFDGDERMSKETQARYRYFFSGDWYKIDPVDDIQLNEEIKRVFENIGEVKMWKVENQDRVVPVRYGDLIRIAEGLCTVADYLENDDELGDRDMLYKWAKELLNLPELLKKPDVTN